MLMSFLPATHRQFTRWQAAGLHLLICVGIAAAVLTVMLGVWYPPPLFEAEGGFGLVFILVGVDVAIGPLITLVVFKPGKPGLRFDLCTIALMQTAALLYGIHVVAEVRPAFIAYVKGQFEVVGALELNPADLSEGRRAEFRRISLTGPVLVAVDPPSDPQELTNLMFTALENGKDMRHFPKYYVPYDEYRDQVLARGQTLDEVRRKEPEFVGVIEHYLAESGRTESGVRYYPLRATQAWGAAVVDAQSGELLKLLLPRQ
jgi:hypothetical protein